MVCMQGVIYYECMGVCSDMMMKRYMVFSDEGIIDGPHVDLVTERDPDYSYYKDIVKHLSIGESIITPDSGVSYTIIVTRVMDI